MSSQTAAAAIASARIAKIQRLAVAAARLEFDAMRIATDAGVRAQMVQESGVNEPSVDTWRALVEYLRRGEDQVAKERER